MTDKRFSDNRIFSPGKAAIISLAVVNVLVLCIVLNSIYVNHNKAQLHYDQRAAERWSGDETEYAEVSLFTADGDSLSSADLKEIESAIYKRLREDVDIDTSSQNRMWIDAYSGHLLDEVRKDGSSIKVNVYTVGGDFFQVHPIPLKSGSYIDTESSDFNQIVLDENVAWNLFGSSDIVGMKVWIGDSVYTITGVLEVSEQKEDIQAYGEYDAVFVPIQAYSKSLSMDSEEEGFDASKLISITCYEAVMPNEVKNYAFNILTEAAGMQLKTDEEKKASRTSLNFDTREVVDNTNRFKLSALFKRNKERKYVDMRTNSITYPYWENEARFEEQRQIKVYRICLVLLIIPVISLIYICLCVKKRVDKVWDGFMRKVRPKHSQYV